MKYIICSHKFHCHRLIVHYFNVWKLHSAMGPSIYRHCFGQFQFQFIIFYFLKTFFTISFGTFFQRNSANFCIDVELHEDRCFHLQGIEDWRYHKIDKKFTFYWFQCRFVRAHWIFVEKNTCWIYSQKFWSIMRDRSQIWTDTNMHKLKSASHFQWKNSEDSVFRENPIRLRKKKQVNESMS